MQDNEFARCSCHSFQHNSIYTRTCVSTHIFKKSMNALWTSRPLRIISDQDLATKSLNTSESHLACLNECPGGKFHLRNSLPKLLGVEILFLYAHWPMQLLLPSKGWPSHCNKVSWPSLVSCSWPASMEALSVPCTVIPSDPARFFFLSTVYVLWRITILTKCSWLICGDVWRCRVFKCYDFACIWWKPTMTAKIRNPGTLGSWG